MVIDEIYEHAGTITLASPGSSEIELWISGPDSCITAEDSDGECVTVFTPKAIMREWLERAIKAIDENTP